MSASNQFYVLNNERQEGPYTEDELRLRLTRGEAYQGTLIWREGLQNWIRLEDYLSERLPPIPVTALIKGGDSEPFIEKNIKFPKWPRISLIICFVLFLVSLRWQSAIEREAQPYLAEYNRMNSTAYNVSAGAEAFVRGFLGDPTGKADEENAKTSNIERHLTQLSADYDSACTFTGMLFFVMAGLIIIWIIKRIRFNKGLSAR